MLSYTKHLGETENNISGLEIYLQRKDLSPIIEEEFASETQNSDRSTSALPLVSPPFSWEARAMHEIRDCSWNFLRLATVEASHQQCLCCYCLSSEAVKYSAAHSTCQSHLSWFLSNVWIWVLWKLVLHQPFCLQKYGLASSWTMRTEDMNY